MPNDYILRFIIHRYRDLTRKVKSKYYEKSACNCEGTEQLRKIKEKGVRILCFMWEISIIKKESFEKNEKISEGYKHNVKETGNYEIYQWLLAAS